MVVVCRFVGFMCGLAGWLVDLLVWFIGRFIGGSAGWLVDWLVVDWLLVGWLAVGWLVSWLVDWLMGCWLVYVLVCCLVERLVGLFLGTFAC